MPAKRTPAPKLPTSSKSSGLRHAASAQVTSGGPWHQPTPKFIFWTILRADRLGEVEQVCGKLCDVPGQMMAHGISMASDTLQPSQHALQAAVIAVARRMGALDRDVSAYCEEAAVLRECGRTALALKYIGRALEASAICFAMQRLVERHGLQGLLACPRRPQDVKTLFATRAEEVLKEVAGWMREYAALYDAAVRDMLLRLHNLVALRRVAPLVYDKIRAHLNPAKPGPSRGAEPPRRPLPPAGALQRLSLTHSVTDGREPGRPAATQVPRSFSAIPRDASPPAGPARGDLPPLHGGEPVAAV